MGWIPKRKNGKTHNHLKFSLGTYVRSHPQKGLFLQLYVLKFSMIASPGLLWLSCWILKYKINIGHLELVPALLYSLYMILWMTDISLRQTLFSDIRGVYLRARVDQIKTLKQAKLQSHFLQNFDPKKSSQHHLPNQKQNTSTLNSHIIILRHFQRVMQSAAWMTALIPTFANLRALTQETL